MCNRWACMLSVKDQTLDKSLVSPTDLVSEKCLKKWPTTLPSKALDTLAENTDFSADASQAHHCALSVNLNAYLGQIGPFHSCTLGVQALWQRSHEVCRQRTPHLLTPEHRDTPDRRSSLSWMSHQGSTGEGPWP